MSQDKHNKYCSCVDCIETAYKDQIEKLKAENELLKLELKGICEDESCVYQRELQSEKAHNLRLSSALRKIKRIREKWLPIELDINSNEQLAAIEIRTLVDEALASHPSSSVEVVKEMFDALNWAFTDVHNAAMKAIEEGAPESDTRRMSLKIVDSAITKAKGWFNL